MMCSAAPVCPLTRAVSFGKDDYSSLATLYQTSSLSTEKWGADSITKCSQQAATAISLLFSPLNRTPSSPATARSRAARYYALREPRFDLLALLPIEISLKILCYLEPRDLSRVCKVSRHWYRLCNDRTLFKLRKAYITSKRAHFKKYKENHHSGGGSSTGHTVNRQQSTPVLSPLNSPLTTLSLPRPQSLTSPSSSHNHRQYTPGPNNLSSVVDNVGRLNLRESDNNDIRRCLFPNTEDSDCDNKTSSLNKLDLTPSFLPIGKKANKNRLRRL